MKLTKAQLEEKLKYEINLSKEFKKEIKRIEKEILKCQKRMLKYNRELNS